MRFLRAFGVAFVTAVAGMFLAIFASDYLTKLYHVSDMEGQRGMTVIFLFAPLGIMVGFIIGLIVALRSRRPGFAGYLVTQGLSILVTIAIAGFVSAFCWVGADHPPKIDGKNLALDFELKIPPAIQLPAELSDYNVRASLYANNRDNRYAKIDINSIRKIEGFTIIPGTAELMSSSANRQLLASIGNEPGPSQFVEINLPARPRKENEEWSNWTFATEHADLTPVPEPERMSVRYRVRVVD